MPLWTEAEREVIERAVSASGARASAGDLPDALVGELKSASIEVACELERLQTSCSCRSRTSVCVHVLAAVYGVVMLVDQQPIRAVDLRSPRRQGRKVQALIDQDWVRLDEVDVNHFFTLAQ